MVPVGKNMTIYGNLHALYVNENLHIHYVYVSVCVSLCVRKHACMYLNIMYPSVEYKRLNKSVGWGGENSEADLLIDR